jgi:hypothetical protein
MRQGDVVIHVGPWSISNGHEEQVAVVTWVWNEHSVNLKVMPDCGTPYDATVVEAVVDEQTALAKLEVARSQDPPVVLSLCWPV